MTQDPVISQDPVEPTIEVAPRKSGKKGLIITLTVVAVILLAAAGAGAWYYEQVYEKPDAVMSRMYTALKDSVKKGTAVSSDTTFDGTVTGDLMQNGNTSTASIHVTGHGSRQGSSIPTMKMQQELSADLDSPYGTFSLAGEYRLVDGVAYGEITKLPLALGMGLSELGITDISNQWGHVNMSDLADTIDQQVKQEASTDSKDAGDIMSHWNELKDSLKGTAPVWSDDEDKAYTILTSSNAVYVKSVLRSERIDGQAMNHYELGFDSDKGYDAFKQVVLINADQQTKDDIAGIDPADEAKAKDYIARTIKVTHPTVEIWIGKWDNLPHKLTINGSVDSSDADLKALLSELNEGSVDLPAFKAQGQMEMRWHDFGKAVSVSKPDSSVDLLKMIQDEIEKEKNTPVEY